MTVSPSSRAGRLLLTEAAALLPILHALREVDFDRPTVLPGWTVRDVVSHCSAALARAVTGDVHAFTPADNQKDVDERSGWPLPDLLAELEDSYVGAAVAMDAAGGRLDGLALGEWVHGGDVRQALGRPDAWASSGLDDALTLLAARSVVRGLPATAVTLTGPGGRRDLRLGPPGEQATATLETDAATLVRLCAGRCADLTAIALTGAAPEAFLMFT